MKLKIKVGDEVLVTTGKDKGRKGVVLALNTSKRKIRVKDVAVLTHFDKKEGIKKYEGFIDYSNVKLVKATEKKYTRRKTTEKKKSLLSK